MRTLVYEQKCGQYMALTDDGPSLHALPYHDSGESASDTILTCAQLHILADQICALRQISVQLYWLKNPTAWARRPFSFGAVSGTPSTQVPGKANGKKRTGASFPSGSKNSWAPPAKKQTAGRRKKARQVSDEEDIGSDISVTDEGSDGPELAASVPCRRPRRRKSLAVTFKDADSDEDLDETKGKVVIDQGPARLPNFTAITLSKPKEDSDILCDVCGDAEGAENNVIILCDGDGCAAAVHQQCYGVASLPEGEWRCDGCVAGLNPAVRHCLLCPVAGGALRSVVSLGSVVPPEGVAGRDSGLWVHSACALWLPEVTLQHPDTVSGVQLDRLSAVSAELECGLCRQRGGGLIQCAFGVCWRAFHVLCARDAGNRLALRESDGAPLGFCALHSKKRFARTRRELEIGAGTGDPPADDAAEADEASAEPNEYELQRLRNIERNKQRLAELQRI